MGKLYLVITFCILTFCHNVVCAAPDRRNSLQQEYIEKYYRIAISERERSRVPASITLAQGLLESGFGKSELAVRANNHFGIKCHDWKGQRIYFDDDRKGECFRKYRNPEESYRDHSDFLRYRDRYKFLFDFRTTDYKSWAYGLKKAGYATDPAYPKKLINLIEEYDLDRFDRKPYTGRIPKKYNAGKNSRKDKAGDDIGNQNEAVQELPSPTELETPKPLSDRQEREFTLSLTRQMYSQNGVPFIYSVKGETYASIARNYDLFRNEILRFNDLDEEPELMPGTIVYLQPKKSKAARHVDKYVAEGGETLYAIAQRYAVKLDRLLKMNGLDHDMELAEGDMIRLR